MKKGEKYPSEQKTGIREKITTSGMIRSPSFSFFRDIRIKERAEKQRGRKKGSANILQYGHIKSLPIVSESMLIKRPNPRKDKANLFL